MINYIVKFDEDEEDGVIDISLVEHPANLSKFVAFHEHVKQIKFKTVDAEKRQIIGLVLEPNVPIYRADDDGEYTIQFDEQTIEKLAHKYLKTGLQKGNSIMHQEQSQEGLTVVESWTVLSSDKDKSNSYGLEFKPKSWVVILSVQNDTIWQEYVKTGKVLGFSIEAKFHLQEIINKNKEEKMSKTILDALKDLPNQIKLALTLPPVEIKMGSQVDDKGLLIFYDSEVPTVGDQTWIEDVDGNRLPLDLGDYRFEDGSGIRVLEVGLIGELLTAEVEDEVPVVPVEEVIPVAANNDAAIASEIANAIKSIMIKYSEEVAELRQEVAKLNEQPASKGIKLNKNVEVDFSKMTALEKHRYFRENK
jgi:hypothetical protein